MLKIFIIIFLFINSNSFSQDFFNLKGLKKINLEINDPQQLVNDVTEEKLGNAIESQFKSAGFEISEEGVPLVIDIYEVLDQNAASIWLNLREKVTIERNDITIETMVNTYSRLEFVPKGLWNFNHRIYQKITGSLIPDFIKKHIKDNM